jgi:hypothetical protein
MIWVLAGAVFLACAAALVFQNRRLLFDRCPVPVTAPFVPDPQNDKTLLVFGWSEGEVKKIIDDFAVLYELPGGIDYRIRSEGNRLRLVFPDDIEPGLFAFLINYVRYPKGLEPGDRRVESIGMTTLSPAFSLPTPTLAGKRAVIYVPLNDKEYDLVFVSVDGKAYENSFAVNCWRAVGDARMPAEAAAVN